MRHLIEATAGQNKAGDPVAPQLTAIFQLEQRIALHVADHRHHRVRRLGVTCHGFGDLSVIGIEHVAGDQADQSWRADAERPRRDVGDVAERERRSRDPLPHQRIDRPSPSRSTRPAVLTDTPAARATSTRVGAPRRRPGGAT